MIFNNKSVCIGVFTKFIIKLICLFFIFNFQFLYSQTNKDTIFKKADTSKYFQNNTSKTSDDELLAIQFFQNNEFDKAVILFEKLYTKSNNTYYYNYYLQCLLELNKSDEAEKIVKRRIKKEENSFKYKVDLGYIYQYSHQEAKAIKEFENAIKELNPDNQQIFDLANAFLLRKKPDYAIKTYQKGRQLLKNEMLFSMELADIYYRTGDFQNMLNEYFNFLADNRNMVEQVEYNLQTFINNDLDNSKNDLLKKTLLKRIQTYPSLTIFTELLLWQFLQLKNFAEAFQQAKSLDRTYKENGERIFNIAKLASSNNDYDVAIQAYDYIISKGKEFPFYTTSIIEKIETKYQKFNTTYNTDKALLNELEREYIDALNQFGKNQITVKMVISLASLQAFSLNKYKEAINLLNEIIPSNQISKSDKGECKIKLADILLMSGDVWEATLVYSQVEKDFKNNPIGYEAKFKNAKLFYYIGEFDWVKGQLEVLKASTSKLIANDAMELYLIINDNIDIIDSSIVPLKLYAKADFQLFQNKLDVALNTLDSISIVSPGHAITPYVYYKKAEIAIKKENYLAADSLFELIINKYGLCVIADDALFRQSEINEYKLKNKDKAMAGFEKLLKIYPSSIFTAEARKRYRTLRGDKIN